MKTERKKPLAGAQPAPGVPLRPSQKREPWPWRLELTTNLSRYGVPPGTGSVVRMAAALYLAQRGRGRLGPLLDPKLSGLSRGPCPLGPQAHPSEK